jgi:hypothetical protein
MSNTQINFDGKPFMRFGSGKTSKVVLNKEWIEKRYFVDKVSLWEIAKEINLGKRTVYKKFEELGFKCRPLSEAMEISPRLRVKRGSAHARYKGGIRNREGYLQIKCKDHPDSDSCGYVFVHRILAEIKLGRKILSNEEVHHIDGDPTNMRLDNLEVLSKSQHMSHHMTEKQLARRSK